MSLAEFKALADRVWAKHKETRAESGDPVAAPRLLLFTDAGAVEARFAGEADSETAKTYVRGLIGATRPYAFILISDSWLLKRKHEDAPRHFADASDRRAVMTAFVVHSDWQAIYVCGLGQRDDGKTVLDSTLDRRLEAPHASGDYIDMKRLLSQANANR